MGASSDPSARGPMDDAVPAETRARRARWCPPGSTRPLAKTFQVFCVGGKVARSASFEVFKKIGAQGAARGGFVPPGAIEHLGEGFPQESRRLGLPCPGDGPEPGFELVRNFEGKSFGHAPMVVPTWQKYTTFPRSANRAPRLWVLVPRPARAAALRSGAERRPASGRNQTSGWHRPARRKVSAPALAGPRRRPRPAR